MLGERRRRVTAICVAALSMVGLAAVVTGLAVHTVRLTGSGLSVGQSLSVIQWGPAVAQGLLFIAIGGGAALALAVLAYIGSSRPWDSHGPDWEDLARPGSNLREAWAARDVDERRFAFRAQTIPLVDLAGDRSAPPWASGQATSEKQTPPRRQTRRMAPLDTAIKDYVEVAGPVSPLWQPENGHRNESRAPFTGYGLCAHGASGAHTAERNALRGQLGKVLIQHAG